ncbi:LysR substrate-binding domain-containing protein [Pseudomonas fontis]|uniref:LysR substrate-binding domain-containing protein n=1 Tax=Pseudomonas fontis TaxID=2942633 RepID=A0ABT5NV65_9PSED|nr:LysR substrate-binding domain-containing protein [Pseudomonas fontis]MDD0974188.1 LysR substrate-binding domain-containing protein [Pseudomonas fontis]MDD0992068.1 LysR substrate-binding domain-containing protein [Pseudomonas fontis]
MALPPLYSFKVFECVARLGSLAAASVELHVTSGAVSQQIKALQGSLGVELFEKRGRQLALTASGRVLQQRVARAMGEIRDGVEELHASANVQTPPITLTLSLPPAEGITWLATLLFELMADNRALTLNLLTATYFNQVNWRKADIAVVYGSPPWPGYWWRQLHGIQLTPVCSPQYLRGPQAIRSVDDLARHRLLHEDAGEQWQQWLTEAGGTSRSASHVYFEDFALVLQAARDGFGVALSDETVSARDLNEGRLVQPLAISVPAVHNYYCICTEDAWERREVKSFIDWLLSTAN